jgi:hypothetical protein
MGIVRIENLAFQVFCLSTIFITAFSVQAIYSWPPLAEKISIFLGCALPIGLTILGRLGVWTKEPKISKELIWVLLVLFLGLLSCHFSENKSASLKSMGLFIATGPLIFVTAKTLFESTKNQESYLWIISVGFLVLAIWGVYEHFSMGIVYIFSRNPLPAGVLLILFSIGPLILLNKPHSNFIRFTLILCLASSLILIIFMAKKSHLLGLTIFIFSLILCSFKKFFKCILGLILLIGVLLFSSDSLRGKYTNMTNWSDSSLALDSKNIKRELPLAIYGSIPLRVENYFFGLHIIKKNPVWGLGFDGNFDPYFEDYNLWLGNFFSKERYNEYIKSLNTFENIVLTYTIEWGCLFALVYFGGIIYLILQYFKTTERPEIRKMDKVFVMAVIISFSAMSLTFDTLRFPNLNWVFHSILGLLANLSNKPLDLP